MIWLLYKCSFLILLITFHIERDTVAIVNRLCLSLAKQKTRRLSDAVRQIAETRSSTTHVLIEDESLEHHNGSISPFICRNSENISIMWFTRLRMRIHININTAHILRATVQSILHHRGQWTDYILSICLYLTAFIVVCYWRWYFASSRSRKEKKIAKSQAQALLWVFNLIYGALRSTCFPSLHYSCSRAVHVCCKQQFKCRICLRVEKEIAVCVQCCGGVWVANENETLTCDAE